MFEKVLIANRGEIALRIHRACREMGIETVAVYSTADSDAMHVRLADQSVCIGPPPAPRQLPQHSRHPVGGRDHRADAIHPGYGFLSENARFAEAVEAHGITFIGPTPEHIAMMGDKIVAKQTAKQLGLPLVPGSAGPVGSLEEIVSLGQEIGWPVLIKAVARRRRTRHEGDRERRGRGRGLRACSHRGQGRFNNDSVYLEKYLGKPRHIEIQVLGDGRGEAVHLGERDCSLQRRHQKVLEESPSPALNAAQRERIGELAAAAVRKLKYRGAGTMEFLFQDGEFYFIEMNTRLQVEHPITEAVTGIDLVREQIRIAAGGTLGLSQKDIVIQGHAIECRINAENSEDLRALPRPHRRLSPAGRPRCARRFRALCRLCHAALLRFDGGQADRERANPQRVPDAAAPLARGVRDRRHRHHDRAAAAHHPPARVHRRRYDIHWLEKLVGLKK